MKVYRFGQDNIEPVVGSSVTVGSFDGVHAGHFRILEQLTIGKYPTVVTFDPHPQHQLRKMNDTLPIITPFKEKVEELEKHGVERVVVIRFDESFANLSASAFLEEILIDVLGMSRLVAGWNHAFGRNREGNSEYLAKRSKDLNFELVVVKAEEYNGLSISSTKIRNAVKNGDMLLASSYLNRPYRISGKVVHGDKRGKRLGYPTANIELDDPTQLIPAEGVYAVKVLLDSKTYPGVGSIGRKETFGKSDLTIEVHLFDEDMELYHRSIKVEWIQFIRQQEKFMNAEELIEKMDQDSEIARKLFSSFQNKHDIEK